MITRAAPSKSILENVRRSIRRRTTLCMRFSEKVVIRITVVFLLCVSDQNCGSNNPYYSTFAHALAQRPAQLPLISSAPLSSHRMQRSRRFTQTSNEFHWRLLSTSLPSFQDDICVSITPTSVHRRELQLTFNTMAPTIADFNSGIRDKRLKVSNVQKHTVIDNRQDRRTLLTSIGAFTTTAVAGWTTTIWLPASSCQAATSSASLLFSSSDAFSSPSTNKMMKMLPAESSSLPSGLLESRVMENVLSPPPYGMEGSDVYYPSWLAGTWQVTSTTVDIQAPCGIAFFGGNATWTRAQADLKNTLQYTSRFIPGGFASLSNVPNRDSNNDDDTVDARTAMIGDREYNVASIVKAAMGPNSIVNIATATPNQFSCTILAPMGSSSSLVQVDLLTLNRRAETMSSIQFDCSEVVREIIRPVRTGATTSTSSAAAATTSSTVLNSSSSSNNNPTILKDIETTSLYTYHPATDTVSCRQRSAAYLVPSQQDPLSVQLWQATRGRPVDVRFYQVSYKRL